MFGWFKKKPPKEIKVPDLLPGGRLERMNDIRNYRRWAVEEKALGNDIVAACLLEYARALERSLTNDI